MKGVDFFGQAARLPPLNRLHPQLAAFFKEYLSGEKVIRFGEQYVLNTHFPPYPSPAFDMWAESLSRQGQISDRRVHSLTLAVTNRCKFSCWHCYNTGRGQEDMPLESFERIAEQMSELSPVMVTLTGGEPLLRDDLSEIARLFAGKACVNVATTGAGFTKERASELLDSGVFGVGISLDSMKPEEHDHLRGSRGAFKIARKALAVAAQSDLYPYIVSVATRGFLHPVRFIPFLRAAREMGAREVHILEPSATGKLAGRTDVVLTAADREQIIEYQYQVAQDEDLPILSTMAYLESPDVFGCGAGLTHLYIDGAGEVCPCNLVPLSFGNVQAEPLAVILQRMGTQFSRPRTRCASCELARQIPEGPLPAKPEISAEICSSYLPRRHGLPRFFHVRAEAEDAKVGAAEIEAAYDRVSENYDRLWLTEARRPVDDLLEMLNLGGAERVFDAGCGTGYASARLASATEKVVAVDLSEGMLVQARRRTEQLEDADVEFIRGDALELLPARGPFDVVFASWALGYIPVQEFLAEAHGALLPGGQLAFVVHRDGSPQIFTEILDAILARDPAALQLQVAFDAPADADAMRLELTRAGFEEATLWAGEVIFWCGSPAEAIEHLMGTGAGAVVQDALDPEHRDSLMRSFLSLLTERTPGGDTCPVTHDYIAGVARRG